MRDNVDFSIPVMCASNLIIQKRVINSGELSRKICFGRWEIYFCRCRGSVGI